MKKIILSFILILAMVLMAMEIYFRFSHPQFGEVEKTVLTKNKRFTRYHFKQSYSSHPDFSWHGTFDVDGMRVVPDVNKSASEQIIFAGCSYTLGAGVMDDQNFPAMVAKEFRTKKVINWGLWGDGPHGLLSLLQSGSLLSKVQNKNSSFVYTIIEDQLLRAAGKYSRAGNANGPRYVLKNETLKRKGDWQPEEDNFFSQLSKSHVALKLGLNRVPSIESDDILLNCKILKSVAELLDKNGTVRKKYLILYPGFTHGEVLTKCLRDSYQVLDYSKLFKNSGDYLIPGDGHPSVKAHSEIARKVMTDLQ